MEINNPGMGQGAPEDPNAAARQQDAQFSQLTNLAHLISGSEPAPGGDAQVQQAAEDHIGDQEHGGGDGPAAKRMKVEDGPADAHVMPVGHNGEHAMMEHASAMAALDPNMLNGLTPDQLVALQQAGMPVLTPEMLAAAMAPATGPDGQPLAVQIPLLHDMSGQAFAGAFDPAALGMPSIPGMDMLQQLPPEQLQAFIQNPSLTQFLLPGGFPGIPSDNEGNSTYKNWWDEKDEQELMQMVSDTEYRREKLGTDELDWAKLETYFNRSQNALRKKFWTLSKGAGGNPAAYGVSSPPLEVMGIDASAMATAAAAAAAAMASAQPIAVAPPSAHPRSRSERKNWSEEETLEMVKIVSDAEYRAQLGLQEGEDEVMWDRLGAKFGCTVQTAKRKYRHLQDQAVQNNGIVPEKRKREHYRKSVPYRWMFVSALSKIPGFEATAPQIFESIEQDPELRGQLDIRIMPGTKHVPRWKIQIRKVLSADHIFINTGVKQKHETIWRLDPVSLQEANADRQRQRAGVPPIDLATQSDIPGDGSTDAIAALGQLPMNMQLNAEQTMAMLQQQQQLMGMLPGQTLQLPDGQQLQLMGLPEGTIIDPATLAAMMAQTAPHHLEHHEMMMQQHQQALETAGEGTVAAAAGGENGDAAAQQGTNGEATAAAVDVAHQHQNAAVAAAAMAMALGQESNWGEEQAAAGAEVPPENPNGKEEAPATT